MFPSLILVVVNDNNRVDGLTVFQQDIVHVPGGHVTGDNEGKFFGLEWSRTVIPILPACAKDGISAVMAGDKKIKNLLHYF